MDMGVVVESFEVGETVRINTPGESHYKRTGVVVGISNYAYGERFWIDLGDVTWKYSAEELMRDRDKGL